MKNSELLDQLLAHARRAPGPQVESVELSKGVENSILDDWRRARGDDGAKLIPILRWGFGFAVTASLLIIATTTSILADGNQLYEGPAPVNTYSGPLIP
jgi:hypothetical protein